MTMAVGLAAGTAPLAKPLPEVHRVGRFAEDPRIFIAGDLVLSPSDSGPSMVAVSLDGSGEKWRRTLGNVAPVVALGGTGDVAVLAFGTMRIVSEQVTEFRESVLAVDLRTGRDLWQRAEEPVVIGAESVVVRAENGPLSGVDIATGRELWRLDLAPEAEVTTVEGKDELIVSQPDGTLFTLDTETGAAGRPWRIGVRLVTVWYGWNDLVVVQGEPEQGTEMVVFRWGEPNPLWRKQFVAVPSVSPCGNAFCAHSSGQDERLDPYTGATATAIEEPPPYDIGKWEPIGEYRGTTLVRIDPSWTADTRTWLGEVTPEKKVHPLMPLGGRSNTCILTGSWLYCDGSTVVDAVSVRLSDLDELLAEVGGPA